ncbi:MAG: ATP-binding protein [Brachymonas sp.]|nr:ATP-binding protein [Brachymonas sp.]
MTALPLPFPFAAITGQPRLTQALLLAAIDPALGGVLIEGPRGTAKSTAARALAALLAPAPFVTLPLGASLEHLVGTLDLDAALTGHAVRFAPGLLARAHGGVLYVDEINLLPDALVDALLDAAASGIHTVERDGISHTHAARFVLIGTMNPEEGALRPQLLDRLGLCVRLENLHDPAQRQTIVKSRLAFDANPAAFTAQYADAQATLMQQLNRARTTVQDVAALPLPHAVHEAATRMCLAARVDGLRADMVMLRAARALAAWEAAPAVTAQHVNAVAEMVLLHRRHPDAPATPEVPPASNSTRPDQDQQQSASPATPPTDAPPHNSPADAGSKENSDGEWGALPPQPAGINPVKPLKPLRPFASSLTANTTADPAKKA